MAGVGTGDSGQGSGRAGGLSALRSVLVVLGCHVNFALQNGLTRSVGVLYLSWQEAFGSSAPQTAAIQSIMASSMSFCSVLGGILCNRLGCRRSTMIGGALAALGLLFSSWVNRLVPMYILASVTGLGSGIVFNASLVATALSTRRRYKLANAVAFSGSGLGILVMPQLLQLTLAQYGWRGTHLIAAALVAHSCVAGALFGPLRLRRRRRPETGERGDKTAEERIKETGDDPIPVTEGAPRRQQQQRRLPACMMGSLAGLSAAVGLDLLAKSYRYALVCVLMAEANVAYMGYVVYLVPHAQSQAVATPSDAPLFLSALGVGSFLGRLCYGIFVGPRLSGERFCTVCLLLLAGSQLLLLRNGYASYLTSAVLFGLSSGAYFTVSNALVLNFVGIGNFATGIGLFETILAIGVLIGPVFAGWVYDITGYSEVLFYIQAGVFVFCAAQTALFPLLGRLEPGLGSREVNP